MLDCTGYVELSGVSKMKMHCNVCRVNIDNSMGFFCPLCNEQENIGKGTRYNQGFEVMV